eukprot:9464279-Pyramimonas_sp.AAC.1
MEQLTGGCGIEIGRGVEATRSAWRRTGRLGELTHSIWLKKMAFKGIILSAAYSGLESYLPRKLGFRRLDAVILGFARVVLRDRKPEFAADAPEGARPRYRSLPESTVMQEMDARAELL